MNTTVDNADDEEAKDGELSNNFNKKTDQDQSIIEADGSRFIYGDEDGEGVDDDDDLGQIGENNVTDMSGGQNNNLEYAELNMNDQSNIYDIDDMDEEQKQL